jgi:hypothetical protein
MGAGTDQVELHSHIPITIQHAGETAMKKRGEMWTLAGLAVMGLLIAGCSDNQTGPGDGGAAPLGVTTEKQAIEYYAVNDGFVGNDEETFADREVTALDAGSFGKIDAAVTPIRFARVITGITKTVETTFEPGDEVAIAHVTKDITGIFKILVVTAENETLMVEKPFNDVSERNVVFKRLTRNPNRFWMNWMPVSSTLVKGGTVPPNNFITIKQLELITGDTTIVITDPLEHYLYYGWMGQHQLRASLRKCMVPELVGGQEVRIRVTLESTSPDTDFVAVRYGFKNLNWKRYPMTMVEELESGGVYTRVYETVRDRPLFMHYHRGWFNLGIDAVTHETLFDDQAPYSASWWGVPYRVF